MTEIQQEKPIASVAPYDGQGELLRGSLVSVLPQARKPILGHPGGPTTYKKKFVWKYTLKDERNGKLHEYEETLPEDESPSLIDFIKKYGGMSVVSMSNKLKI